MSECCAVLDVGKSNTKLSLVSPAGAILTSDTIVTPELGADRTAFDVDRMFEWACATLKVWASAHNITRIIPVTHGAACVLLDADLKPAFPVQDYERAIEADISAAYSRMRPAFSETLSPELPLGLNLGRQIFAAARRTPDAFARVRWIVPYPQYFAWRFSGALTCERTSIGCHTDLWRPEANAYSSLVQSQNWTELFPPLVNAWDEIGTIRPEIAQATGLAKSCVVHAGVHDTNAALFPFIAGKKPGGLAILSTGTWVIAAAPGGDVQRLDAARDCLANVDVFGRAVPSARFMGGREHNILSEGDAPTRAADYARVLRGDVYALPSFCQTGGPFPGREGAVHKGPAQGPYHAGALATIYLALMSDVCLDLAGASGTIIVEGPAAKDEHFLSILASLRDAPVERSRETNGVTIGANALARWPGNAPKPPHTDRFGPLFADEATAYRARWRSLVEARALA